jgi:hypothetical protein
MFSCISSGCREAARSLQKDTFVKLLSQEVIFRCHTEKRSMFLRELRERDICVTEELNVYFHELEQPQALGGHERLAVVPTEAFLLDDLKAIFVEENCNDGNARCVFVYKRRFGMGVRPVVFHVCALELARLNPILSTMGERRKINVRRAEAGKGSFRTKRSVSMRSTEAGDSDEGVDSPLSDSDDFDDDASPGFAPRSARKVNVLIGKVPLGVPARMDLAKACDVCNFLVGFGVSTNEFEEFANKLACKNRSVVIKDGMVSARGLGVLSRSLPDLIEFRQQQEALAEVERQQAEERNVLRVAVRRSAQTVVSNALKAAVLELTSSSS